MTYIKLIAGDMWCMLLAKRPVPLLVMPTYHRSSVSHYQIIAMIAPLFWHNFYAEKLRQVQTMTELQAWEEVLSYIGFGLPESSRIELEGICAEMTHFLISQAA
jgi:hypothetical protein